MSDFWSDPSSTSILHVRTAKALASLRGSLVAYVISTIISWAGSFRNQSFFQLYINWSTKWVLVCLTYQYLLVWRAHLKSWDWRPAIPGITKGRMSMLILIYVTIPLVTGHFVPRSFRTQVISYHFGHFIPTFIFNLVISYPVWSICSHFVPSLVISYLFLLFPEKPFWSFRTYFLLFRTQVISYPKSFRTHFSHFVPRSFRTHFQTRYELTWVRHEFVVKWPFFCVSLYGSLCARWKGRTTFW